MTIRATLLALFAGISLLGGAASGRADSLTEGLGDLGGLGDLSSLSGDLGKGEGAGLGTYSQLERAGREEAIRSPLYPRDFQSFGRFYEDTKPARLDRAKMWEDEEYSAEGAAKREFLAGERKHPFNAYPAFEGFKDMMQSDAVASMMANLASSPTNLLLSTWKLVESGIADAYTGSITNANLFVMSRYLADIHLMQQGAINPETAQVVLGAYQACVSARMKEDGTKGSWVKAQVECLNDSTEVSSYSEASGEVTAILGDESWSGKLFSMKDDLNRGDGSEDNCLNLSDYLFNQEIKSQNDGLFGEEVTSEVSLGEVRDTFLNYIGDVKFCLNGGLEGPLKSKSTMDVQVRRMPPISKDATNVYGDMVNRIFTRLTGLMKKRCEFVTGTVGALGSGGVIPGSGSGAMLFSSETLDVSKNEFWKNVKAEDWMALSMKGYSFKPYTIDAITLIFLPQRLVEMTSSGGADCDAIGKRISEISKAAASGRVEEGHRLVFFLAKKIALGQLLGSLRKAQEILRLMTVGPLDTFVSRYGTRLIADATGTTDLDSAYNRNLDELINFTDQLLPRLAGEVGRSGASLNALVNQNQGGVATQPGVSTDPGQ